MWLQKASSFKAIVCSTPPWLEILNASYVSSFGLVVAIAMPAAWATRYLLRKRTSFCERKSSPIIKFRIHNNKQTRQPSLTKTLQGSIYKIELLSGGWLLRNRFAIVIVTTKENLVVTDKISRDCTPARTFTTEYIARYRLVCREKISPSFACLSIRMSISYVWPLSIVEQKFI